MATPRKALVSGAGAPGGIGFAIAKLLKANGFDLVKIGRAHV